MNVSRRRPASGRGFTLIELLVVIGLIAILSSLLLMGINHLIITGKRQATQLAFQNCQAMYSEYDRIARRHFTSVNDPYAIFGNITIPSPGLVTTSGSDRQGLAVYMTRDMIGIMRSNPVNAAALGKMSASAQMSLPQFPVNVTILPWTSQIYPILTRVQGVDSTGNALVDVNGNPIDFTCITIAEMNYAQAAQPQPPSDQYWLASTIDATVPVMLDGWGDPIIFVPSGGLSGVTAGGSAVTVKSPDGRPFWASAGPDGNFSAGDDNMYSYEK